MSDGVAEDLQAAVRPVWHVLGTKGGGTERE